MTKLTENHGLSHGALPLAARSLPLQLFPYPFVPTLSMKKARLIQKSVGNTLAHALSDRYVPRYLNQPFWVFYSHHAQYAPGQFLYLCLVNE